MASGDNAVAELGTAPPPDSPRRADVDAKQEWVVSLLERVGSEGLLVLDPANFRWLTSGAAPRGLRDPEEYPALYFNAAQRWLVCSNVDTQQLFDEEVHELGFQLKEWPWHGSRQELLDEITSIRRVVCDVSFRHFPCVEDELRRQRVRLTGYERDRYLLLGRGVAHALEATARNLERGQSEEEVAGQLGHRLLHRGVEPVTVQVLADGRGRTYRRAGFTRAPVRESCVLTACGTREGLYATASRTVTFGRPSEELRADYAAAARVTAALWAGTRPGVPVQALLDSCRRLVRDTPHEHEFGLAPPGYRTGRSPVEGMLGRREGDNFYPDEAILWQTWVGSALACDTVFVGEEGAEPVTAMEEWPIHRTRFSKGVVDQPDILVRDAK